MWDRITRRVFIKRASIGIFSACLDPSKAYDWLSQQLATRATADGDTYWRYLASWRQFQALWEQTERLVPDDEIPTRYFTPGYTQTQLQNAWLNGDLVNGFPYGLIDTHTLGGVPDAQNVNVDETDGSAILSIHRLTTRELQDLDAVPWKKELMLEGKKNGLDMELSVAAFFGRLPTDIQSIEATITLPQRILTGDPNVGMVGDGWTLWTIPDIERLKANLTNLGVPPDENAHICSRVFSSFLEEDIAEMGIAEPSTLAGDPLVLRLMGGHMLFFMAGRKTPTQKYAKADIMHILREPLAIDIPPDILSGTIRGWLAQNGGNADQVLKRPLRVSMDIGDEVYDSTRDAMVVPMRFRLNDGLLTPKATGNFPGFEKDPGGNTTPNLSIWKIKTRQGDWVNIPRQFIIDFGSINRAGRVQGDTDSVRFGNVIITRRKETSGA